MPETEPDVTSPAELAARRRAQVTADLRHAAEDAEQGELSGDDLEWVFCLVETRFCLLRGSVAGPKSETKLTPEQHAVAKAVAAVAIARQYGGRHVRNGMAWKGTIDGTLRATLP